MNLNLLTAQAENGKILISEAALYALIGSIVVLAGIALLIAVVWVVGKFMSKEKAEVKPQAVKKAEVQESLAVADGDTLSDEEVVVITAALMAYYQTTNPKCEFTVKRIKRI